MPVERKEQENGDGLFSIPGSYAIIFNCVKITNDYNKGVYIMKHIKIINSMNLKNSLKNGGCGECQSSCQSACKTSCTVGNQKCENN